MCMLGGYRQHWPHYSLSLKGNIYQQAVVHFSIGDRVPDKDNNWDRRMLFIHPQTRRDRLCPPATSPHSRDDWGVWSLGWRKLEDNSCALTVWSPAGTESIPSHALSVVRGNLTPLSVWTVLDNLDVEPGKSKWWVLVIRLWGTSAWDTKYA